MKLNWTIKKVFTCYRALLIILGLEFVFQFTQIKNHTFGHILSDVSLSFRYFLDSKDIASFISSLSEIIFKDFAGLVLLVCVFSGVLLLYKRLINHESVNMGFFVRGIEKNWKKVFVAALLVALTFGIVNNNARVLILRYLILKDLVSSNDLITVYIIDSLIILTNSFITALTIYGSLIFIENGIKIKELFVRIFRFIFSKEALKLLILLFVIALLYQPINIITSNIMSSHFSNRDILSFLKKLSQNPQIPLWLLSIRTISNTLVTSFILLYTSLIFYWGDKNKDVNSTIEETSSL